MIRIYKNQSWTPFSYDWHNTQNLNSHITNPPLTHEPYPNPKPYKVRGSEGG